MVDEELVNILICEIIFSENNEHEIDVMKYIDDVNNIDDLTDFITKCLNEAGIHITEQIIFLTKRNKKWKLKIKFK